MLLHSKPNNSNEALERGIFDGVAKDAENLEFQVMAAAAELLNLNLPAYASSKRNLREAEIEHLLELLKKDISGMV